MIKIITTTTLTKNSLIFKGISTQFFYHVLILTVTCLFAKKLKFNFNLIKKKSFMPLIIRKNFGKKKLLGPIVQNVEIESFGHFFH